MARRSATCEGTALAFAANGSRIYRTGKLEMRSDYFEGMAKVSLRGQEVADYEVEKAIQERDEMKNGLGIGYSVPKSDMEEFARELFAVDFRVR